MVGTKVKISKICLSGLAEIVFLEAFLCTFCMSSLQSFLLSSYFFCAYIMSYIALVLKG